MVIGLRMVVALTFDSLHLDLEKVVVAHPPVFYSKPISFKAKNRSLIHLGANGAGKSSLLKALAGLIFVYSGTINGRSPKNAPSDRCYLCTNQGLNRDITVKQQIKLWHLPYQNPTSWQTSLEPFNIEGLLTQFIRSLSSGQRQRVALTRLVTSHKPIWLLDEPMNNLDNQPRNFLSDVMKRHIKKGGMIIYTGHEPMPTLSPQIISLECEG